MTISIAWYILEVWVHSIQTVNSNRKNKKSKSNAPVRRRGSRSRTRQRTTKRIKKKKRKTSKKHRYNTVEGDGPYVIQLDDRQAPSNYKDPAGKIWYFVGYVKVNYQSRSVTPVYVCAHCKRVQRTERRVSHYNQCQSNKQHICKDCNRGFAKRSNLTQHRRVHGDKKPWKCRECKKGFARKETLRRHLRNKNIACSKSSYLELFEQSN